MECGVVIPIHLPRKCICKFVKVVVGVEILINNVTTCLIVQRTGRSWPEHHSASLTQRPGLSLLWQLSVTGVPIEVIVNRDHAAPISSLIIERTKSLNFSTWVLAMPLGSLNASTRDESV